MVTTESTSESGGKQSKGGGKKPILTKLASRKALFGEDTDSDEGGTETGSIPAPIVTSQPIQIDSDSDSIILSSDSESLTGGNTTLTPVVTCPTLDLDDVDLSDADPFDECLEIFNATPPPTPKAEKKPVDINSTVDSELIEHFLGKRREARPEANTKSSLAQRIEAQRGGQVRMSAQNALHNRMKALLNNTHKPQATATIRKASLLTGDPLAKRSRTAHTPRPTDTEKSTDKSKVKKSKKTAAEGSPKKKAAKRPIIPADFDSKVPTNVRQQYLNRMIDDCLKIYTDEQRAFDRALSEEKQVLARSNNKAIYLRVAVNAIKKLRDEAAVKSPSSSRSVSHSAVLGGAKAQITSFTLHRTGKSPHKFSVELLVRHLEENYLLSDPQLEENGFPRPDPDTKGHIILKERVATISTHKDERQCVRCGTIFQINAMTGEYLRTEQCIYHWGKAWKTRIARVWENKWTCCGGDLGAKGCQICPAHVHEYNRSHDTTGYVKTLPRSPAPEPDCRVYALDCEMVYTTHGNELARVTVVDYNSEVVLEKMVKPSHTVIDYNTRFSSITEADMRSVRTTIRDVQAILLSLFCDSTILIGHSLESDLIALKIMHTTVVDTSVVFPHKMGPPYKRALKTLAGEILRKIIQEDVGGHNSLEDAACAMELMVWKTKDDLKHSKVRV